MNTTDEQYMRLALKLARKGLGRTSPNPMVGAVIVKDGRIIARGYHKSFGLDHAEVAALKSAKEDVAGATLYVSLEPCRHHGKTPPCTDAIIKAKIGRVVIAMLDPDPRMRGESVKLLRQKGIKTAIGVLEAEARALNEKYVKHRATGLPYVTLKWAQTLDGRIAAAGGSTTRISSPPSLKLAHKLRAVHDAILVGVNTVLKDDPQLTTRLVKGRNPLRIILDSRLRAPLDAKVLKDRDKAGTLVVTTPRAPAPKLAALKKTGVEVLTVPPDKAGRVDLKKLLEALGKRDVSSLLVEGGGEVITSFLRLGMADRLVVIIAPKILGKGTDSVGDLNITDLAKAYKLKFDKVYRSGEDIVVEGEGNKGNFLKEITQTK
ncbi:MAG: bifunctional diaminohydroxyphosphoribosylaminopyrimidine deaminase/5-amino-6-(5-phosphoribosylamino)uracil reductase RibD [Dehalococcoidales bacterium]|nr:bifunctional diaminohydroxyphosphoribosylaminopyrimidine deaminase/5-amino-6-(5-phosphoribosylamino)uracil reductase RibD [Dehalococcoidales bacterium]